MVNGLNAINMKLGSRLSEKTSTIRGGANTGRIDHLHYYRADRQVSPEKAEGLIAFLHTTLMCWFQDMSLLMVIPRHLAL